MCSAISLQWLSRAKCPLSTKWIWASGNFFANNCKDK